MSLICYDENMKKMKWLEEMSREELIEEIISNTKRLEEMGTARKEEERKIAELERQEKLLTDIEKTIKKTASSICQS